MQFEYLHRVKRKPGSLDVLCYVRGAEMLRLRLE